MKKCIIAIFVATLLTSCSKNKCWVLVDCLGNDVGGYCGTERQVQEKAQSYSTPTCTWGYRAE